MTKYRKWMALGVTLILALSLTGCVSQTQFDALMEEKASQGIELASLQADYAELEVEKLAVEEELAEIKEVYPPRDFFSLSELQDWLLANDVSERPDATIAETAYSRALEIQEDALKDGYVVSVDVDYNPEIDLFFTYCITIINGDIWYWEPQTDEPRQYFALGKVK